MPTRGVLLFLNVIGRPSHTDFTEASLKRDSEKIGHRPTDGSLRVFRVFQLGNSPKRYTMQSQWRLGELGRYTSNPEKRMTRSYGMGRFDDRTTRLNRAGRGLRHDVVGQNEMCSGRDSVATNKSRNGQKTKKKKQFRILNVRITGGFCPHGDDITRWQTRPVARFYGPKLWNALPDNLRAVDSISTFLK